MNVSQICELAVAGGLLDEAGAEQQVAAWQSQQGLPDDGNGFVDSLVSENIVSEFQADALKAGVGGPYKFGPYRVNDRLAGGRLGTIYRAVHDEFDQPVSLKVFPSSLKDDSDAVMRLARETRIAVQVNHPNIVRTFQVGKVGEIVFLAFEDLDGETLESALKRATKLPEDEACRLIRDAARALVHLHELDIVLRDIQPSNLWVTTGGHTKLMEFGAARDAMVALDDDDVEDDIRGTFFRPELLAGYDYMSPEQGADEAGADARSDIYSLGCIFFEALTGEVVFPDVNPIRKALRHAREEPRLVSDIDSTIPHAVADIVNTMLAKEPSDRYQRAEDVVWALDGVISAEEEHETATLEIDEGFLKWAGETSELPHDENVPTVVAEPDFIDFLDWVADEAEAEDS
ncbi:MAG: serine/threonine protein kinase [Planctomycetaceae bacterium]|jgi:eukaryotic-like serine/threonine-protein kinase|nr:serine/threonine protein kinase [Planctomycetaceae bacterium]MBT6155115.1 serine/threonine protein kinase [Planctomycetaceae bacterium]MBT6483369.1 serine/threonine protein kinase [Planctomycetaceae bacterium]MBT6493836.1 serine/threonine protein kinase [Planctomycetaceae bacterium]